jgi:Arc/MetJ family transcription regulator
MMRTTLSIDDSLIDQLMRYTRQSNAIQALRMVIQSYVEHAQRQELLAMRGTVQLDDNWSALRKLETAPV